MIDDVLDDTNLYDDLLDVQAKAEEENRVDMKNSELSATNDLSSVYR